MRYLSFLKDTRKKPKIEIQDIVWGYYLGAALRLKAISTIEEEISQDVLKRRVNCALRLLKRIVNHLGVRFLDIVICDALYCNPNFFKECEKLKIVAGAVLKCNQENLLESALAQKKITEPVIGEKTTKEELELWDFPSVFWDTADTDVRVIWADRKVSQVSEGEEGGGGERGERSNQPGQSRGGFW